MADETETYAGAHVSIVIDGARCIHSRNCVLGSPAVFVPNAVGPWVHPDNADAGTVAAIAESCPSGAIRFSRNDGGAQESAPPVNTIRIRENGPLAFHAELAVGEERSFFRATLCRCGASERKPYCDGSHDKVKFQATGEPPAVDAPPPGARDGPLGDTHPQRTPGGDRIGGDRVGHGAQGDDHSKDVSVPLRSLGQQAVLRWES